MDEAVISNPQSQLKELRMARKLFETAIQLCWPHS